MMENAPLDESQRRDLFRHAIAMMVLLVLLINGGRYLSIPAGLSAAIAAFLILSSMSVATREPDPNAIELRVDTPAQ